MSRNMGLEGKNKKQAKISKHLVAATCDWLREEGIKGGRLSLHVSKVAHQVSAYPGFCSMKGLQVFLLPPGWDASPSHGYLQQ